MINDAASKGYETTLNLMALSTVSESELRTALAEVVENTPVNVLYVVDSFGSLYSEQIRDYVKLFLRYAGENRDVGIHAHNNMQLAYANTIEAIIAGANRLDVTIHGLGRGAGNCPTELLLMFLKNPKFKVRPVLECIERYFFELQRSIPWGYSIPYAITGALNQHPRDAIAWMEGDRPNAIVEFYDRMLE
jgi:4-hydroxy 2-oxovalerate aldolase